ncbi:MULTISPECIES: anti-sigma factor [unclassified Bosea (in: a-proteobacteria)]|uniref:anti-sigma factor family protein n=1 Tax=unclassified Bosea (in: a-proteobacteria) TaxID=2653178 RepID=UPI00125F38D9|nr:MULTISPECIES: anti-sigma factor [unclassified Bosea (in: a-proteobacteria)]
MPGSHPIGDDDIQAFIDGRLAPARQREVEAFLASEPALRSRIEQFRADAQALRAAAQQRPLEPIPASLRLSEIRRRSAARNRGFYRRLAAGFCIFAFGAALGLSFPQHQPDTSSVRPQMSDAVVAFRAFAGRDNDAVEVPAAQTAVLKRLMSDHLRQDIAIPDLSGLGLAFRGGRLLASDEGPGGMFVYREPNGGEIALYVKTLATPRKAPLASRQDGDLVAYFWFTGELGYAVLGSSSSPLVKRAAERLSEAP